MLNSVKVIVLALLAIAIVSGCKGPPRPGYNPGYGPRGYYAPPPPAQQEATKEAVKKDD